MLHNSEQLTKLEVWITADGPTNALYKQALHSTMEKLRAELAARKSSGKRLDVAELRHKETVKTREIAEHLVLSATQALQDAKKTLTAAQQAETAAKEEIGKVLQTKQDAALADAGAAQTVQKTVLQQAQDALCKAGIPAAHLPQLTFALLTLQLKDTTVAPTTPGLLAVAPACTHTGREVLPATPVEPTVPDATMREASPPPTLPGLPAGPTQVDAEGTTVRDKGRSARSRANEAAPVTPKWAGGRRRSCVVVLDCLRV